MARTHPIFDVPPLPEPTGPLEIPEPEAPAIVADICDHKMVLVEKIEHRFQPQAMQTVYTHRCVNCGMVVSDEV